MSRKYPEQPVVGVGGIVLDGERVLLVKRGREPQKGIWSIPGGKLELGETLREGTRRELREETGIEVDVGEMVEVFERITKDDDGRFAYHYVLVDFLCDLKSGDPHASDDADEVAWIARERLAHYKTTVGAHEVIEKAFQMRDKRAQNAAGKAL